MFKSNKFLNDTRTNPKQKYVLTSSYSQPIDYIYNNTSYEPICFAIVHIRIRNQPEGNKSAGFKPYLHQ